MKYEIYLSFLVNAFLELLCSCSLLPRYYVVLPGNASLNKRISLISLTGLGRNVSNNRRKYAAAIW